MNDLAIEPASGFFESKRLRLHYTDWGNAGAPLMIILHGGLEHGRVWDDLARSFRAAYHVVCPDLRGHGESDWSSGGAYSALDNVLDIASLVRHLGGGRAIMIGHSFGGNVAVRYAALYPENVAAVVAMEGLVMPSNHDGTAAPGAWVAKLRAWMDNQQKLAARRRGSYKSLEEAAARLHQVCPRATLEWVRHVAAHGLRRQDDGTYAWKYDETVRGSGPSDIHFDALKELWAAVPHPVLLIYGAASWASNPATDGRAALFRDARVVLLREAGHNLHHEQPEGVRCVIADFLERLP